MTGTKLCLLGAIATSVLPVGQLDASTMGLLDVFKAFGTTGLLIVGLVYVVHEGKARQIRLETLLEEHNKAAIFQAAATAGQIEQQRTTNTILEDFRVTIEKCKQQGGG